MIFDGDDMVSVRILLRDGVVVFIVYGELILYFIEVSVVVNHVKHANTGESTRSLPGWCVIHYLLIINRFAFSNSSDIDQISPTCRVVQILLEGV